MSEVLSHSHPGSAGNASYTADKGMPDINVTKIIQLIAQVAYGDKSPEDAAKELARPYQTFAVVFARNKANELVSAGLGAAGLGALSDSDFSEKLLKASENVAGLVKAYMHKDLTEEQLISLIGGAGIKDMNMQVLSALGVQEKLGVDNAEEIMKLAPAVVAFTASMAAYKELRKALDDMEAAKERRVLIEASCQESISMIRQYRAEMERIVSNYLTTRLETFESGFEQMDKAMLEGDIDGYIKGNTEIQAILGHDVQFSSQDEFDALMDSDDAFTL